MARTSRKKSKGIIVDFKGVEGKLGKIDDGDYLGKVVEVTQEEGQNGDYLKWTFELQDEGVEGRRVFLNTSLLPQALWNLRGLLEALGVEVPDDEMDIDPAELVDLTVGLTIESETWEGKKRPKVADYFAAEEDEAPKKKSSKKKSKADDDDEDEEDEPKKPLTRAQKRKLAKAKEAEEEEDDEEDEKPARKSRRSRDDDEDEGEKPARKSRRASRDDDDDDDEDEDEKPARGKKKSKAKGPTEDEVNDMTEEELEELIEEHELKVDLGKSKTLTKKRNVTIDALTEAGVI